MYDWFERMNRKRTISSSSSECSRGYLLNEESEAESNAVVTNRSPSTPPSSPSNETTVYTLLAYVSGPVDYRNFQYEQSKACLLLYSKKSRQLYVRCYEGKDENLFDRSTYERRCYDLNHAVLTFFNTARSLICSVFVVSNHKMVRFVNVHKKLYGALKNVKIYNTHISDYLERELLKYSLFDHVYHFF